MRRPAMHCVRWADRAALAAALASALLLLACATAPAGFRAPGELRAEADFAVWRQRHATPVAAFESEMAAQGLRGVVPLHELLRSASDWQRCAAEPYALPPPAQWPAVWDTLRLLRALQQQGALRGFEVVSAHRAEALNRCAGGAARSAHLVHFAVDLVPHDGAAAGERLCRFWREQGPAWQMGLGRYPTGRLHVDTLRHRSWGGEGGASLCGAPAVAPPAAAASAP